MNETFNIDETVALRRGYANPEDNETIALLQEEIMRLEAELAARSDRPSAAVFEGVARAEDECDRFAAAEHAAHSRGEVERLTLELASRDETLALLLDQLGSLEETRTAERAEWDQLAGWVAELERRVEGQDEDAFRRLQASLANQQKEAEELRTKFEHHRRGWEVQRAVYEGKIARLQEGLAKSEARARAPEDNEGQNDLGSSRDIEETKALEAENLRLIAQQEMTERIAGENSAALHSSLCELQNERDELQRQLDHLRDERRREKLEHEATCAELRTRASQASLIQPSAPQIVKTPKESAAEMEPYLRIQALRQHLLEIHEQQEEERRQRKLMSRLSRLWSRTGPR
jgi:uncharacterized small protein (DUF1192 family)